MVVESLHAYVAAVRADHRHQGSLVHHVRSALASGASSNWDQASVQQILASLDEIHQHLEQHFAREEEGGYLEEALVHAPRLKSQAAELMAEHPLLLKKFGELVAAAKSGKKGQPQWPLLASDLSKAIDELVRHEMGENQLLQDAFAADLNLDE